MKDFQSFSLEIGSCQTICTEDWDTLWDTVLHDIQMVCLTLNKHKFSTHLLRVSEACGSSAQTAAAKLCMLL